MNIYIYEPPLEIPQDPMFQSALKHLFKKLPLKLRGCGAPLRNRPDARPPNVAGTRRGKLGIIGNSCAPQQSQK